MRISTERTMQDRADFARKIDWVASYPLLPQKF